MGDPKQTFLLDDMAYEVFLMLGRTIPGVGALLDLGQGMIDRQERRQNTENIAALDSRLSRLENGNASVTPAQHHQMQRIQAGSFWCGTRTNSGECTDEAPRHRIRLTRDFQLGRCPVTQALYALVVGTNPSSNPASPLHPVENVSWFDAVRFCNRLSHMCGLAEAYTIGNGNHPVVSCNLDADGFRLPTEAEWEYAAKARRNLTFSGSNIPNESAWYAANSRDTTHAVAQKAPNAWGLYDMSGNVEEWCFDAWRNYTPRAVVDPCTQQGRRRVVRGGHASLHQDFIRTVSRCGSPPHTRDGFTGFRIARTVR